jgi:hypothetical protein
MPRPIALGATPPGPISAGPRPAAQHVIQRKTLTSGVSAKIVKVAIASLTGKSPFRLIMRGPVLPSQAVTEPPHVFHAMRVKDGQERRNNALVATPKMMFTRDRVEQIVLVVIRPWDGRQPLSITTATQPFPLLGAIARSIAPGAMAQAMRYENRRALASDVTPMMMHIRDQEARIAPVAIPQRHGPRQHLITIETQTFH